MTRSGLDVQITPVCLGSAEQRCVFCEDFSNSYHLMRLVSFTILGCGCSFQQEKVIGASMAALREGLAPTAPASTWAILSPSSPHLTSPLWPAETFEVGIAFNLLTSFPVTQFGCCHPSLCSWCPCKLQLLPWWCCLRCRAAQWFCCPKLGHVETGGRLGTGT